MNGIIYRLKNVDKRKRRFISMLTAMFMVFTFCGDSLKVFAEIAGNIEGIENVTGNTDKNAELLDCPDADEKYLGMAGDFTIFVKEKFTIPKDSADIEGRLAAGGGIENNRPANETYTIGNRYLGKGATVLVGGGQIDRITTGAAEGSERRIFVVSSDTDITYETGIRTENTYISDDIIDYAIKKADPYDSTLETLKKLEPHSGRLFVFSIGKAAVPMAKAAADFYGDKIFRGLVVTKYGHSKGFSSPFFKVIEAAHPLSDGNSLRAAAIPG